MKTFSSLGIILILTFAIFLPTLFGEFLAFDDELLILDNPTVHGLSFSNIAEAFTTYDPELYIPLTLLTHQVEWSIVGGNPLLYHIINLLLHLLSTGFVFLILRKFFTAHTAAICTLLFSLHPLQVESVAWISGRKDLLSSMFFLASIWSYTEWKETGRRKTLSLVLFTCGLLSKVSIFPLPFCLLLLDYLRGENLSRDRIKEKIPYFVLAALFLLIAIIGKSAQISDPLSAIILSPVSLLLTIKHTLAPMGLSIFYPFVSAVTLSNPQVLVASLVLLCICVSSVYFAKKHKAILFAALWFIILVAPSLLNMQKGGELGISDIYLTSDRYTYLAIIGPIIVCGYFLKRTSWYIGIVPVAILIGITVNQIPYWHNSDDLFRRVIDTGQPSHVAYTNLGGYAAQSGNYEQAELLFSKSLSIRRTTRILFNLAQIKAHLGKTQEARDLYKELLQINPNDSSARSKLQKLL